MSRLFDGLLRALRLLPDLVFVPRCACCGTRLPPGVEVPLCPICRTRYEDEKEVTCPTCGGRMCECLCTPPNLPRCGVRRMVKLLRYRPSEENASAQMIYRLKHKNIGCLQRFFAKELALPLSGLVEQGKEWVVTYPPRSIGAKERDGFDHAAAVAAALARELGCAYASMLRRCDRGGRAAQQKQLSRTARFAAAKKSYGLRTKQSLVGRRVILFDDVMTTGATLSACARLLRRAGAKEVVFAVLALTPSKKGRDE